MQTVQIWHMSQDSNLVGAWTRRRWVVRKALDKNRALLRTLRNLEGNPEHEGWRVQESKAQWLVQRGFDFQFHTHLDTLSDGRVKVMCFDEGFVMDNGDVELCPE